MSISQNLQKFLKFTINISRKFEFQFLKRGVENAKKITAGKNSEKLEKSSALDKSPIFPLIINFVFMSQLIFYYCPKTCWNFKEISKNFWRDPKKYCRKKFRKIVKKWVLWTNPQKFSLFWKFFQVLWEILDGNEKKNILKNSGKYYKKKFEKL